MTQLVLDDQLDVQKILPSLKGWLTSVRLQDLRPGERILDDRVPQLLLRLKKPTFVTIDRGFWRRRLGHPDYCIVHFAVSKDQQEELPRLLRLLFRLPQFRTRAARMGKVARVGRSSVIYWEGDKKVEVNLPRRD
jgi:hypothetical protein